MLSDIRTIKIGGFTKEVSVKLRPDLKNIDRMEMFRKLYQQ